MALPAVCNIPNEKQQGLPIEAATVTITDTDEALIAQAKRDPAAFGLLYERYVTQVYNYVFHRLGNTHEAEDITAKVFYKALTHLDRYTYRDLPFSVWLLRIAHNLVANWHRDTKRHQTFPLDSALYNRPMDPDDYVIRNEEHQELLAILNKLPSERRLLLVLKYVEGMSNAQIAAVMGRSERAVKALLHRTLMALRAELEKNHDYERKQQ